VQGDGRDRVEDVADAERRVARHAAADDVDVGVDQAGEEGPLAQVEDLVLLAGDRPAAPVDLGDPVAVDHNLRRGGGAAGPIEQALGADNLAHRVSLLNLLAGERPGQGGVSTRPATATIAPRRCCARSIAPVCILSAWCR
jgi:hypothetical protein